MKVLPTWLKERRDSARDGGLFPTHYTSVTRGFDGVWNRVSDARWARLGSWMVWVDEKGKIGNAGWRIR